MAVLPMKREVLAAPRFATGCHRLQPRGSIEAPSLLSALATPPVTGRATCRPRSSLSRNRQSPQYAVSTRRSNAFATIGGGGESLTMTTIWRVASRLE